MIFWEDIRPGSEFETPTITLDKAEIVEFAEQFDPQPFHLQEEAGEASIFGGFCASGWQVCAMMMRLLTETFERRGIAALDSPGVPSLRWLKPVHAGDTLSARILVEACEPAADPATGLIRCRIELSNQHRRPVLRSQHDLLLARRPAEAGDV